MKPTQAIIPLVFFALFFATIAAAMAFEAQAGFFSGPPSNALNAFLSDSGIGYYQIPYISL